MKQLEQVGAMRFQTFRGKCGSGFTFISILLYLHALFTGTTCQTLTLSLIPPASFNATCTGLFDGVQLYSYKITVDTTGTNAQDWPRTLQFSTTSKTGGSTSPIYLLDFTNNRCIVEDIRTFCSIATGSNTYEINSTYLASVAVSEGTYQVEWLDYPPSAPVTKTESIPLIYDDSKVTLKVNGTEYDLANAICPFPHKEGEIFDYTFCADRADIVSLTITFGTDAQTIKSQPCFTRSHSYDGEGSYSFTYSDGCGRVKTYCCCIPDNCGGCSAGGIAGIVILSIVLVVAVVLAVYFICFWDKKGKKRIVLIIVMVVVATLSAVGVLLIVLLDCICGETTCQC